MRWLIYEDPEAPRLRPFTWLRPPSSLLLGTETLEARWRRLVAPDSATVVCRSILAAVASPRSTLAEAVAAGVEDEIWASDLLVPDERTVAALRAMPADTTARHDRGGEGAPVLCAFRPGPTMRRLLAEAGREVDAAVAALDAAAWPAIELSGDRLRSPADLVRLQEPLLEEDLQRRLGRTPPPAAFGDGLAYERDRIRLGRDCRIDHGAVLDARDGPVVLGDGCRVFPHTWIRGPFFADRDCLLLGGGIGGGTSLGPSCRVRGEVEASVFLGWSNKAHDGFVGHSYLGEWVNLGASTTTSDLKNNYSEISLERDGAREPTGLKKVGVFFGDHVKTRIGCLLGCGTILGLGANLIGEPAVAVRWVPDFRWGWGPAAAEYALERFLETAEIVLGRRGVPLTPEMVRLLSDVHATTRAARR